MRPLAAYIRSLNPELPRDVWILQAGGLANFFGNGIVIPFLIIYLHNVKGISLAVAGLIAASNSAAALISGPIAGVLSDRIGPRRTLAASLVVMTVATAGFPLIETAWHALALNVLLGFGSGGFWPSQSSLLTALTPPDRRHAAFAQQRVTMNLGFGLGGLTGGLIANAQDTTSFTILFLLDAATFVAFGLILTRIRSPRRLPAHERRGSYRDVLRNRPFMRFWWLTTAVVAAGMVPLSEFVPVFAKNESAVSEKGIGVFFLVNTLAIVIAQLPIAKLHEGRRRMPAFTALGVLWAVSWLLVFVMGAWLEGGAALALLIVVALVFALGACLHGTVQGPLVVDLADPRALGRYMAMSALAWQVAFVLGPAIGGFILDVQPLALWPVCALVCLLAGVVALILERDLPRHALRTPRRVAPLADPVGAEAAPAPGMATRPSG